MLTSFKSSRSLLGPSLTTLSALFVAVSLYSLPTLALSVKKKVEQAQAPSETQAAEQAQGEAEAPKDASANGSELSAAGDEVAGDKAAAEGEPGAQEQAVAQNEGQEAAANQPANQEQQERKPGPSYSLAIPAGKEEEVLELFKPMALGAELPGDYVWNGLSIEAQSLSAKLVSRKVDEPEIKVAFVAVISGNKVTGTKVRVEPASLSEGAQQAVAAFRQPVEAKLSPKSWNNLMKVISQNKPPSGDQGSGMFLLLAGLGALVLGTIIGVVLLRKKVPTAES